MDSLKILLEEEHNDAEETEQGQSIWRKRHISDKNQ